MSSKVNMVNEISCADQEIFYDGKFSLTADGDGGGGFRGLFIVIFNSCVSYVFKVRTQTPFLPDPYIHFTCILHFIWDPLDCCSQLLAPFTVCLHGYKAAYINQQLEKLHLYIFKLYY